MELKLRFNVNIYVDITQDDSFIHQQANAVKILLEYLNEEADTDTDLLATLHVKKIQVNVRSKLYNRKKQTNLKYLKIIYLLYAYKFTIFT